MANERHPLRISDPGECVRIALEQLGHHWVVGAPLGLGKPNHVLNALYLHARSNPEIRLDLFTALSLNPPKPARGLAGRFLGPFVERHFGDYPRLAWLQDLDRGDPPSNININEFYLRSGSRIGHAHIQRHYVSSNYTHIARDMRGRGLNLLVQMVSVHPERPGCVSLSSNPDTTLDVLDRLGETRPCLKIAQINPDMPYMTGDAEIPETAFDVLLEGCPQPLFGVPRMPVSDADFLIGLYASALVHDGGTLQLGIGSLGDAVCHFTGMRHTDNADYLKLTDAVELEMRVGEKLLGEWGGLAPFDQGVFAASEMFMDGFLHLYEDGVLKRRVYDHAGLQALLNDGVLTETLTSDCLEILWRHRVLPWRLDEDSIAWLSRFGIFSKKVTLEGDRLCLEGGASLPNDMTRDTNRKALAEAVLGDRLLRGDLLHAAFFLGSKWMYDTLNSMSLDERDRFRMTRVSSINQLYRGEELDRAQRLEGRFINTTMKMTLLGAAVSDQLKDGQVVSGVGGQYNFVAMAHALDRSRSILMARASRGTGKRAVSNIVWEYPHVTIPRHLRDIVITEYGVADLRGRSDEECIQALLCITDSRWQEALRRTAVKEHKLHPDWRIPDAHRHNTEQWVQAVLAEFHHDGTLSEYPFGSDFSGDEQSLARALGHLRQRTVTPGGRLLAISTALGPRGRATTGEIEALRRMGLERPVTLRERLQRRLLVSALKVSGRADPDQPA